jgi:hypothetical protein
MISVLWSTTYLSIIIFSFPNSFHFDLYIGVVRLSHQMTKGEKDQQTSKLNVRKSKKNTTLHRTRFELVTPA